MVNLIISTVYFNNRMHKNEDRLTEAFSPSNLTLSYLRIHSGN